MAGRGGHFPVRVNPPGEPSPAWLNYCFSGTGGLQTTRLSGEENGRMGTRQSINDYPPIMDTADVAELLSYRAKEIRMMAGAGRIPAHRQPVHAGGGSTGTS